MTTAIGPWALGAEYAHCILLLLCYRYNIHRGIWWYGERNFGYPLLRFIDRFQIRTQEIYNVLLYPKHRNISQFKALTNFVSIGIMQLCYSSDYVNQRIPSKVLKDNNFNISLHKTEMYYFLHI